MRPTRISGNQNLHGIPIQEKFTVNTDASPLDHRPRVATLLRSPRVPRTPSWPLGPNILNAQQLER